MFKKQYLLILFLITLFLILYLSYQKKFIQENFSDYSSLVNICSTDFDETKQIEEKKDINGKNFQIPYFLNKDSNIHYYDKCKLKNHNQVECVPMEKDNYLGCYIGEEKVYEILKELGAKIIKKGVVSDEEYKNICNNYKADDNYIAFILNDHDVLETTSPQEIKSNFSTDACYIIKKEVIEKKGTLFNKLNDKKLKRVHSNYCKGTVVGDKKLGGYIKGVPTLSLYKSGGSKFFPKVEELGNPVLDFTVKELNDINNEMIFLGGNYCFKTDKINDNFDYNIDLGHFKYIKDFSGKNHHINITKTGIQHIKETDNKYLNIENNFIDFGEDMALQIEELYQNKKNFTMYLEYEEFSDNNDNNNDDKNNNIPLLCRAYVDDNLDVTIQKKIKHHRFKDYFNIKNIYKTDDKKIDQTTLGIKKSGYYNMFFSKTSFGNGDGGDNNNYRQSGSFVMSKNMYDKSHTDYTKYENDYWPFKYIEATGPGVEKTPIDMNNFENYCLYFEVSPDIPDYAYINYVKYDFDENNKPFYIKKNEHEDYYLNIDMSSFFKKNNGGEWGGDDNNNLNFIKRDMKQFGFVRYSSDEPHKGPIYPKQYRNRSDSYKNVLPLDADVNTIELFKLKWTKNKHTKFYNLISKNKKCTRSTYLCATDRDGTIYGIIKEKHDPLTIYGLRNFNVDSFRTRHDLNKFNYNVMKHAEKKEKYGAYYLAHHGNNCNESLLCKFLGCSDPKIEHACIHKISRLLRDGEDYEKYRRYISNKDFEDVGYVGIHEDYDKDKIKTMHFNLIENTNNTCNGYVKGYDEIPKIHRKWAGSLRAKDRNDGYGGYHQQYLPAFPAYDFEFYCYVYYDQVNLKNFNDIDNQLIGSGSTGQSIKTSELRYNEKLKKIDYSFCIIKKDDNILLEQPNKYSKQKINPFYNEFLYLTPKMFNKIFKPNQTQVTDNNDKQSKKISNIKILDGDEELEIYEPGDKDKIPYIKSLNLNNFPDYTNANYLDRYTYDRYNKIINSNENNSSYINYEYELTEYNETPNFSIISNNYENTIYNYKINEIPNNIDFSCLNLNNIDLKIKNESDLSEVIFTLSKPLKQLKNPTQSNKTFSVSKDIKYKSGIHMNDKGIRFTSLELNDVNDGGVGINVKNNNEIYFFNLIGSKIKKEIKEVFGLDNHFDEEGLKLVTFGHKELLSKQEKETFNKLFNFKRINFSNPLKSKKYSNSENKAPSSSLNKSDKIVYKNRNRISGLYPISSPKYFYPDFVSDIPNEGKDKGKKDKLKRFYDYKMVNDSKYSIYLNIDYADLNQFIGKKKSGNKITIYKKIKPSENKEIEKTRLKKKLKMDFVNKKGIYYLMINNDQNNLLKLEDDYEKTNDDKSSKILAKNVRYYINLKGNYDKVEKKNIKIKNIQIYNKQVDMKKIDLNTKILNYLTYRHLELLNSNERVNTKQIVSGDNNKLLFYTTNQNIYKDYKLNVNRSCYYRN